MLIINKIDSFCGPEKLLLFLKKEKNLAPPEKRILIINIICFLTLIYKTKVNIKDHAVDYREVYENCFEYLIALQKKKPSEMILFLIELETLKLNYISNLKKIIV